MADQLDRLKAALADRYRIERELGSGGMATVYLAEDLKHERKVAVKVFRSELTAALGSERFFREIKITANLSHPHILPLLDSGRAEGRYGGKAVGEPAEFFYYVMPYVEGESLRDRLNREKQLSIDEALKITSQVASALSYAHSQGIVHRDIKPENILFQAGEAVVADFGIALAVDSAGGTRLTETGFSLGTPAYMSPEQVSGQQAIDGRSDTYSLACVLYEMLAGDPPFVASNPRAVLAKHMTDPAPPITTVRSSAPQPVAVALAKALGKAPADRFESAKAFVEALFVEMNVARPQMKSIVVLPFENLSPDPDNEYFSDGLTDEIIADLSRLQSLRVISRNSAMQLKGTDKNTRTIGRELNVQYVLEGTVRRAADRVRITAQLIDAENDAHLWAEKYDGVLEDVFDMQDRVSSSIVNALELALSPGEKKRVRERPIENVQAYQCYLRARHEVFQWTPDALARAMRHLQRAREIIGENVLLHSGLAYVCYQYSNLGLEHEQYIERSMQHANKALELDPESAEAHLVLGLLYQAFLADQARSFMHLKKALSINPDDAHALFWLCIGHSIVGRTEDAVPLWGRLKQADPLSSASYFDVFTDVFGGKIDQPVESLTHWLRMEPQNVAALVSVAWLLPICGHRDEACRLIDEYAKESPDVFHTAVSLLFKHAIEGDVLEFRRRMTDTVKHTARRDPQYSCMLADAYALAGMYDEALDWLENALNRGWVNYPFTAKYDPLLAPLRHEQRFQKIAERMKREWEEFEV